MDMVFNEASTSKSQLSSHDVNQLFSSFLNVYSKAVSSNLGISRNITTSIDLNSLELSTGYYVAQWRNSPSIDRDEKRRFLGILERQIIASPHSADYQFVQYDNITGTGLQIAYENQSILISFSSIPVWKKDTLQCMLYDVEQEAETPILLNNIYSEESLSTHKEWLKEQETAEYSKIKTAEDFISNLSSLFPSLAFHSNAIFEIKNRVNPVNIPTIVKNLLILEYYFSTWDGGKFDRTAFPPRFLSPESEETLKKFKSEHTFEWEGTSILVSYHVRYTGGNIPGRIYIYPQHDCKKCLICSLHTKLPTISDPKF